MNHTMTPEPTDAEVDALIGGYDGYDRQDDIAVDYHLAGVVVYNYATQESVIFTEAQLQTLVDFVSPRLQWYQDRLARTTAADPTS